MYIDEEIVHEVAIIRAEQTASKITKNTRVAAILVIAIMGWKNLKRDIRLAVGNLLLSIANNLGVYNEPEDW